MRSRSQSQADRWLIHAQKEKEQAKPESEKQRMKRLQNAKGYDDRDPLARVIMPDVRRTLNEGDEKYIFLLMKGLAAAQNTPIDGYTEEEMRSTQSYQDCAKRIGDFNKNINRFGSSKERIDHEMREKIKHDSSCARSQYDRENPGWQNKEGIDIDDRDFKEFAILRNKSEATKIAHEHLIDKKNDSPDVMAQKIGLAQHYRHRPESAITRIVERQFPPVTQEAKADTSAEASHRESAATRKEPGVPPVFGATQTAAQQMKEEKLQSAAEPKAKGLEAMASGYDDLLKEPGNKM